MEPTRRLTYQDYTVGWICALPAEMAAAAGMLDELHDPLPSRPHDDNTYTFGRIGEHNIVIACLPSGVTGTTSAANVARDMLYTFDSIRFGLMVGIGGGVPSSGNDIRLGDVVVSKPSGTSGGVIQYDFGKTVRGGQFTRTGSLNRPPNVLLGAVANLQAKHMMEGHKQSGYLSAMVVKYPGMQSEFVYQGAQQDQIFEADYDHPGDDITCERCDVSRLIHRPARSRNVPVIFYGLIACANQVMRHGQTRDRLGRVLHVLCFEMEATGLMDSFPCLVIRGICDYSDSHKNKRWQPYAAATAAAYAKELLYIIPGKQVVETRTAADMTTAAASSASIKPVFLVPFERDKQFVGREDILSRIDQRPQYQRRVSLHGIGGIGKSQIAIEYAYRFFMSNPRSHVFWVYAANAARFDQAYRDIARRMKLPRADDPDVDVCELVSDWLSEDDSGQWVMILDNADNADLFFAPDSEASDQVNRAKKRLVDYLPRKLSLKQSLIITTRNRQLGEDLANEEPCIEVRPFALEEAKLLLRSKAGSIAESWSDTDSETLLEVLGRIPLAITQAAAFMRQNRTTLQGYVKALERDEHNLRDYLSIELQDHRRERGIPNSIFRTWKLSFDQIREQEPRAAAMLSLMAMHDRQKISGELLQRKDERDIDFTIAIGILDGFSLITKEVGKEMFAIHRLVQLSVHVWLEQHDQRERYVEEVISLLADRFPNGEHENWEICESLLPHAQAALKYRCDPESSLRQRTTLLYNISWFEWQQGRYDLAHEKISEAYNLNEKLLGQEDARTLNSLSLLALVLQYQGKYEAAEEMNRRALEGYEKALGIEHPDTLTSVGNLAMILRHQGKHEAAEEMNRRALEGYEKTLGVEHPDTLTCVGNLAEVLRDQGKYEAAEEMNRRALEGREKALGIEHPSTLTSVSNLAGILQDQGKYEAAEEMNRRALEGSEKVLGVEHPNTLTSVYCLAYLLCAQRQYNGATLLYQRAIAGYRKTLGSHHPTTLACSENYSSMLEELNKRGPSDEG